MSSDKEEITLDKVSSSGKKLQNAHIKRYLFSHYNIGLAKGAIVHCLCARNDSIGKNDETLLKNAVVIDAGDSASNDAIYRLIEILDKSDSKYSFQDLIKIIDEAKVYYMQEDELITSTLGELCNNTDSELYQCDLTEGMFLMAESASSVRTRAKNLAKKLGFVYKYSKAGWYDDYGTGRFRSMKSAGLDYYELEIPDDWYLQCAEDTFENSGGHLVCTIDDKDKEFYIFNIHKYAQSKTSLTTMLKSVLNELTDEWKVFIVDNENESYWGKVKVLYRNLRFEDIDYEEVSAKFEDKGYFK